MTVLKNKTFSLVLLVVLLGLAAFLIQQHFHNLNPERSALDGEKINALETRVSELSSMVTQLVEVQNKISDDMDQLIEAQHNNSDNMELAELRAQFEELKNDQNATNQELVADTNAIDRAVNIGIDIDKAMDYSKQHGEYIYESFEAEEVDEAWAITTATDVDIALRQPQFSAAQLADIECKNTMCRLEIVQNTSDAHELFILENDMLIELGKIFKGGGYVDRIPHEDGTSRLVATLVREGSQLPDFQKKWAQQQALGGSQ